VGTESHLNQFVIYPTLKFPLNHCDKKMPQNEKKLKFLIFKLFHIDVLLNIIIILQVTS